MSFENAIQLNENHVYMTQPLNANVFSAPEIFNGKYTKKIDEFSAGVLMYHLLSGYAFPFNHPKTSHD